MDELLRIIIAAAIVLILLFAYMKKSNLAKLTAFVILAAYALGMALSGLAGLISDVDFLSFLVDVFRFLATLVVFVEIGVILYLLLLSKHKTKIMFLKVTIIVYVVIRLLVELNVF